MRLSRTNFATLKIADGKTERIVFDDALPGFGLRLRAGGKRTWIVQYRIGAKHRRVTFGNAEAVDPEDARKRARDILAKVHLGGDPQGDKAEARARAALTVAIIAGQYLLTAKKRLRPNSYAEADRYLVRYVAPIGDFPVHGLKRRDVAVWLNEIAEQRGPHAANRARTCLSAMYTWAMRQGYVDANPVIATGKAVEEISRTRVLTQLEICEVWNATQDDDYGRIVRLLFLTGQRRNEVGAMRWSEIDEAARIWRLPAERTKNGLPHDVPLSDAALAVINGVPVRENRDFLFGERAGAFQGWSKSKFALDKRIDLQRGWFSGEGAVSVAPWRIHDIRRTVVTHMNEHLGILPHVVEAVVNHITGPSKMGVAGIYNRAIYAGEKRHALNKWAEYVFERMRMREQINSDGSANSDLVSSSVLTEPNHFRNR
ncbi:site-specific integrase [Methylobacterium sp. WL9]|uniref:tyrosine-type recombinase/integrase n=1 Tax=Methylobacterium sp. WL9 TaxID=2603898 RepID=UPI0011C7CE2B|nr:site-specific integrase [Methylobacterium sp. WL9]TXN25139.1 site-specific integrase [Methylobacterium sp. WL9]